MSVLAPLSHALAAVLAGAHHVLSFAGDNASWLLAIAAVVVLVRLALLPLTIRGVRTAHASARARPQLQALTKKYQKKQTSKGSASQADMMAMMEERRKINEEHGVPRFAMLAAFAQLPIFLALYHLLSDVSRSNSVGAMSDSLVASLGKATFLGAPLTGHGYLSGDTSHLVITLGLAATAAAVSYLSQRMWVLPNMVRADMPESMIRMQELMPVISAGGMLLAGSSVPLALLVYWVISGLWTAGQAAVIHRWFPTPGSPAAERRTLRLQPA
ncbi:membrane protein insertase YidC [Nocardioides sp. NPDC047086]|uniref:membrane protein insertase YidC n=1 Tax=Nocardioides sp. NPDC047086 TaxID=3154810 RepID=UPI00340E4F47